MSGKPKVDTLTGSTAKQRDTVKKLTRLAGKRGCQPSVFSARSLSVPGYKTHFMVDFVQECVFTEQSVSTVQSSLL